MVSRSISNLVKDILQDWADSNDNENRIDANDSYIEIKTETPSDFDESFCSTFVSNVCNPVNIVKCKDTSKATGNTPLPLVNTVKEEDHISDSAECSEINDHLKQKSKVVSRSNKKSCIADEGCRSSDGLVLSKLFEYLGDTFKNKINAICNKRNTKKKQQKKSKLQRCVITLFLY